MTFSIDTAAGSAVRVAKNRSGRNVTGMETRPARATHRPGPPPKHVAVIGSGVSGLVAAHVLARTAGSVTVFEADRRPGGHADTHDVALPDGTQVRADTAFLVHNDRTYPTLTRLFTQLDIPTTPTRMSMSIRSERTGWQYAGGQGLRGLFAHPRTSVRPDYLRMLAEVGRFHHAAQAFLSAPGHDDDLTSIGDWLAAGGFSPTFREHFATPVISAVWSCDPRDALAYPARSLLTFLNHHGMLSVTGSPAWKTVTGGSRTYVQRVLAADRIRVHTGTPVRALARTENGVLVRTDTAEHTFDAVVVATHPQDALALLQTPTPLQSKTLDALRYSHNPALLLSDTSVLPTACGARASWNYLIPKHARDGVLVSYDITALMRLPAPGGYRLIVTLGGADRIDPASVIATMDYQHPLYTAEFVAAQRSLPRISDSRIAFAGAYHGWGFHEDGALSGLRAAQHLGGSW